MSFQTSRLVGICIHSVGGFHLNESTPSPPPKLLRASHMVSEMPAKSGICSMRSEVNKCTWGGCDKYLGLGPREGRWHGVQVLMGERWFGGGFFDGFCVFFGRWNIRDWFLGEMAEKKHLSLSLSLSSSSAIKARCWKCHYEIFFWHEGKRDTLMESDDMLMMLYIFCPYKSDANGWCFGWPPILGPGIPTRWKGCYRLVGTNM